MSEQDKWQRFRKQWEIDNPPNHQDAWVCGICNRWVYKGEMELDHIVPQGNTHRDKYETSNLQPTHSICNRAKGSKRNYKAWYNRPIT